MKNLLFILLLICSFVSNAQVGLLKPRYIGWPTDSFANLNLVWNPSTYKAEWANALGGGDSIVITTDSICVIYLGDTICVSAASDSFYLSGDTSLCVIHLGDTLCSPYSSAGVTLYTGNGAFPAFAARVVNMNEGSLKFDRKSGTYQGGGNVRLSQYGLYPLMQINQGIVGNSTSPSLEFTPAFSAEDDLFAVFNGSTSAEDYSFGVARSASLNPFTIAEGIDLGASAGRPMMQFYGTGDSIVMVNDVLAGGSLLRLRANTTAAASNTQKGIEVFLRGANATAGQTTYAGYFNNIHSGTGATNYGIYSNASGAGSFNYGVYALGSYRGVYGGASSSSGVGVQGEATSSGTGVQGLSTSGAAVYGISSASGYAIQGVSTGTQTAMLLQQNATSTNTVTSIATLNRIVSGGVGADGVGGSIDWITETSAGTSSASGSIINKLTTANAGTLTSQMTITGVSSTSPTDIIYFEGDRRVRFNGRSEEQQGTDVASIAGAIALGYDGNTFEITGTNAITLISNLGWQNGSTVTLIFTSTASLTDGTANSGTDIGFELAGNANFGATADDAITLKLCEIGGTQRWREISRTAN